MRYMQSNVCTFIMDVNLFQLRIILYVQLDNMAALQMLLYPENMLYVYL